MRLAIVELVVEPIGQPRQRSTIAGSWMQSWGKCEVLIWTGAHFDFRDADANKSNARDIRTY
jgi:hypothetical protein